MSSANPFSFPSHQEPGPPEELTTPTQFGTLALNHASTVLGFIPQQAVVLIQLHPVSPAKLQRAQRVRLDAVVRMDLPAETALHEQGIAASVQRLRSFMGSATPDTNWVMVFCGPRLDAPAAAAGPLPKTGYPGLVAAVIAQLASGVASADRRTGYIFSGREVQLLSLHPVEPVQTQPAGQRGAQAAAAEDADGHAPAGDYLWQLGEPVLWEPGASESAPSAAQWVAQRIRQQLQHPWENTTQVWRQLAAARREQIAADITAEQNDQLSDDSGYTPAECEQPGGEAEEFTTEEIIQRAELWERWIQLSTVTWAESVGGLSGAGPNAALIRSSPADAAQLLIDLAAVQLRDALFPLSCYGLEATEQGLSSASQRFFAECFLARSAEEPCWDRVNALAALLEELAVVASGFDRAGCYAVVAWTQWIQGRSSIAAAYCEYALKACPDYRFALLFQAYLATGAVSPWARRWRPESGVSKKN